MSSVDKALFMLRNLPRVAIHNIRDLPERQRMRELMVNESITKN